MTATDELPSKPQLWLDLDGVFADFAQGAMSLGFDVADPLYSRRRLWDAVREARDFWIDLPLMPDADRLWEAVARHQPAFLSGAGAAVRNCCAGKRAWTAKHFGNHVPCAVVKRREKPFYARPGDILIDDLQENIDLWERAGGIGVLHVGVDETLDTLQALGVHPDGTFSEGLLKVIADRRDHKKFRRKGFTGYKLTEASQKRLVKHIPPLWFTPDSRLSAHHITRTFPAGDDITFRPRPEVLVVGAFSDEDLGCHAVVVSVDGSIRREDGGIYHVTLTYDEKLGPKQSNRMLQNVLEASGGETDALRNMMPDHVIPLDAEFKLFRPSNRSLFKRAVTRFPVTETTAPHEFPSGITGTITTRRCADEVTVTFKDDQGRPHNEDGPSICRYKVSNDETLYVAYHIHGVDSANEAIPMLTKR